ncbi:MAG TPA: nitrilase-related carbon-nitrogen hydrolase [Saprospiraceae bacterium]|nr:nitrilase-related carbon-nitrogen hydrolase [Saprospiraceae bacterium]
MDTERSLKVGLLQLNIAWLDPYKNLDEIESQLQMINCDLDLLVLPEMFTTGYLLQPKSYLPQMRALDKVLDRLCSISTQYQTAIMGTTPMIEKDDIFNRCYLVNNDKISIYDKIHLYSPVGEDKEYTAGTKIINFDLGGITIRPLICYDLRFPYLAMMSEPYQLLIYMANWPIPRIHHWNHLLRARAIENQCYTIGVNRVGGDANKIHYNGSSAIYRFDGEEVIKLNDEENLTVVSLDLKQQEEYRLKLPFRQDRLGIGFI